MDKRHREAVSLFCFFVEILFTKTKENAIIKPKQRTSFFPIFHPKDYIMVFSNLFFLFIFMPALFLAYFIIKNNTYRRIVLLAFSLLFYAWGEPIAIFLMIGLVLGDYLFGRLIDHVYSAGAKKLWLVLAIIFNLSILFYFKYAFFFVGVVGFSGRNKNSVTYFGKSGKQKSFACNIKNFRFE